LVGLKNQLAQTVYNSPLDGYITSLPVHLGENVVPGIQNAVGSLLYQVSNLSIMTVEVKVDETDIPNVKLGQTADVQIDAYPNKTFKGHVTQIGESAVGRTTGTTSGATATNSEEAKDFKVVVIIDDPPPASGRAFPRRRRSPPRPARTPWPCPFKPLPRGCAANS